MSEGKHSGKPTFFIVMLVFSLIAGLFLFIYAINNIPDGKIEWQWQKSVNRQDNPQRIFGSVWYSETYKKWNIRLTNGDGNTIHTLHKTESLEAMITKHKNVNKLLKHDRAYEKDCSFITVLTVRKLPHKKDPPPGWRAEFEILEVHSISDELCYHCEHVKKVKKE